MYIVIIARGIKKMSVNEIKDFMFENDYKLIGFSKEINYYSMKRLKKKRFVVAFEQINRKILNPRTLSIIYKKEEHNVSKTVINN